MIVLKFGGSSLADRAAVDRVVRIIRENSRKERCVVVVSAVAGVTDSLLKSIQESGEGNLSAALKTLQKIRTLHENFADHQFLEEIFEELKTSLAAISRKRGASPAERDRLAGFGEILSAKLVCSMLGENKSQFWDARKLIVTDNHFGSAGVLFRQTEENFAQALRELPEKTIPVLTGFIGATAQGVPTLLGRNGSDYSAAIAGSCLGVREIQIWSDVDGIFSADPRLVKDAFTLKTLSFDEASEMAYFGAKILHPKTLGPAKEKNIPLRIKNTFHPDQQGTLISRKTGKSGHPVKAVSAMENLSLIRLEGNGMIGVPGIAGKLFTALSEEKINVIMISQASSEHSICFVVRAEEAAQAKLAVQKAFQKELEQKSVEGIFAQEGVAIVAAIGEGMRGTAGISGRLFGVLGKNRINILAIAQGSSEKNISVALDRRDAIRALNLIHGVFKLSFRRAHLFVIGKGVIGSKLLEQLKDHHERILKTHQIQLKLVGVADSKRTFFEPAGISLGSWEQQLRKKGTRWDENSFLETLKECGLENRIVIDATASPKIAQLYTELLKNGVNVVTPNKRANTFSFDFYKSLQQILALKNSHYMYETCVGAGLPVISTLQSLLNSGDELIEIQGIFSGTLSYLFAGLETGIPFSKRVGAAIKLGYTEPDPREDLSGMDVARKILILAREAGFSLELKNIKVENLVPFAARKKAGAPSLLQSLSKEDQNYQRRFAQALKKKKVLRYVAKLKRGKCQVGIQEVSLDSPLAKLRAGDNIVIFKTKRYFNNPLIVQGPGAGPDVTAGGLFADILKVAHWLT